VDLPDPILIPVERWLQQKLFRARAVSSRMRLPSRLVRTDWQTPPGIYKQRARFAAIEKLVASDIRLTRFNRSGRDGAATPLWLREVPQLVA